MMYVRVFLMNTHNGSPGGRNAVSRRATTCVLGAHYVRPNECTYVYIEGTSGLVHSDSVRKGANSLGACYLPVPGDSILLTELYIVLLSLVHHIVATCWLFGKSP